MVIAWSKVFKISQSFIKMFLCFIKLPNFEISIFIFLICFFKKKWLQAWPKEKCRVIWKWLWGNIYIYILLYTQIFSCTWLWGEYTGYGKNIHIAIYYLNDKPDFRGAQGGTTLSFPYRNIKFFIVFLSIYKFL